MDAREIELTQSVIDLSRRILEDKQKEREVSRRKSLYSTIVTIAIIICFGLLWLYEINKSYDYGDMTIENKATATIERRETSNGKD